MHEIAKGANAQEGREKNKESNDEGTKERAKGGRQKREREGERRNLSPATADLFVSASQDPGERLRWIVPTFFLLLCLLCTQGKVRTSC